MIPAALDPAHKYNDVYQLEKDVLAGVKAVNEIVTQLSSATRLLAIKHGCTELEQAFGSLQAASASFLKAGVTIGGVKSHEMTKNAEFIKYQK